MNKLVAVAAIGLFLQSCSVFTGNTGATPHLSVAYKGDAESIEKSSVQVLETCDGQMNTQSSVALPVLAAAVAPILLKAGYDFLVSRLDAQASPVDARTSAATIVSPEARYGCLAFAVGRFRKDRENRNIDADAKLLPIGLDGMPGFYAEFAYVITPGTAGRTVQLTLRRVYQGNSAFSGRAVGERFSGLNIAFSPAPIGKSPPAKSDDTTLVVTMDLGSLEMGRSYWGELIEQSATGVLPGSAKGNGPVNLRVELVESARPNPALRVIVDALKANKDKILEAAAPN